MSEAFNPARASFQEICEQLGALHLADPRLWLVGFSGGEDGRTDRIPIFLNPSSDTLLNSMPVAPLAI